MSGLICIGVNKMITEENKILLCKMLTESNPTLFLGAGFSIGSKSESDLIDGKDLKNLIVDTFLVPKVNEDELKEIKEYNLRRVCETVHQVKEGELLKDLLVKIFSKTFPSGNKFHLKLTNYQWRSIYTVNIDDLVENIYLTNKKELFIQNSKKLKEQPNKNTTVLYKLHGCVNKPEEGFIFSESEYNELITKKLDAKLNRLTHEIQNNDVIFIGASLDEPDINYYIQVYKNAGCKFRKNRLVFIDPHPSLYLKNTIKDLDATLIEATTEEFLNFIDSLKYNPDELKKALISLNYSGIHRLSDIEKTYINPYESKLYFGEYCIWQDISDGWIFEIETFKNAVKSLDDLISMEKSIGCFSIYGPILSGKSCLLKNMGYYLRKNNFDVLEYKGIEFSEEALKNYIEKSQNNKFALIVDNGAHNYEKIEKIFNWNIPNKKLIILTASREYYHKRKKYYLLGNNFSEYKLSPDINRSDSKEIVDKLTEKSHLSFLLSFKYDDQISYVSRQKNIINLIISLTYKKVPKRIKEEYQNSLIYLSEEEKNFLLELAVFEKLDIEYYPRELFVEKYGKCINLDSQINISEMGIVDSARMNEKGISLRNLILIDHIISIKKEDITITIINILKVISRYVEEKRSDVWYYIFQCLLKENILTERLQLKWSEINEIFLSVKEEYKDKSYYWLQMGIHYQKNKDFLSAETYLQQSYSIRPRSYQIQHAIARNYLKLANNSNNLADARSTFEQGEKLMKDLIDSKEYYKEKAKPFSVTSYITEKIKFINKFEIKPTHQELMYMIKSLESIKDIHDDYIENAFSSMYHFLEKYEKLNLLKIDFKSPYFKYLLEHPKDIDEFDDPIIEAIN